LSKMTALIARHLAANDCRVSAIEDGRALDRMMADSRVDLIVLDLMLRRWPEHLPPHARHVAGAYPHAHSMLRGGAVAEPMAPIDLAAALQTICDQHADTGDAVVYGGPDTSPSPLGPKS
jgi:hypothetical protein